MMKRIWWISLLTAVALVMVTVALGEKTPEAEKNVTSISDSELIEMMYDPEGGDAYRRKDSGRGVLRCL